MEQRIRYCTSRDGVRLAYAELGEGTPLVCVFAWASNLEMDWAQPQSHAWLERAASRHRLIRFDRRGIGLSQRDTYDFSLSAHVGDLAALVDHLELGKFALWGFFDGTPVSMTYAVEHPDRVSHLILWEPYAKGEQVARRETIQSLIALTRTDWTMARRAVANAIFPTGPVELQKWMSTVIRESASPEVAISNFELQASIDITDQLGRIQTPTLVIQRRGDRLLPASTARAVAAAIGDARYVALEGDIGYVYYGETAHLDAVEEFLSEGEPREPTSSVGPFRTVLFTDIVGHTEMMSRLGDVRGRDVLREHERITREVLAAHGGAEVKTMGDGFMASFGSVTAAVECAIALQRAFASWNEGERAQQAAPLQVRVGLNAGEPIEEEGDLFGATVILASRIAAKAGAGEILVPETVRGLLSGKGFAFGDRGEFVPKGFDEGVRLYEVKWA